MELFSNFPLVVSLSAIIITQILKIPIAYLLNKPVSLSLVISTGGMPSSHSAGVTALITSMILEFGWASPYAAISVLFGIIVIFDSMGVRRQSGEHGIIINDLIDDFKELRINLQSDNPDEAQLLNEKDRHSKEFLGHQPIEVFFGILSGIIITILFEVFIYTT